MQRTRFSTYAKTLEVAVAFYGRGFIEGICHYTGQEFERGGAGVILRQMVADLGEKIIEKGM